MAERYLTGAIQKEDKDAKLAAVSARFLQIGCGFTDFQPPTGRRRFSVFDSPFPQKIGTERNGGLARAVAERKYHWAITGWETVEDLPDDLRDEVTIVRHMEDVAPCQYRFGVSALAFGVDTLEELEKLRADTGITIPQTLEELKPGTSIATKHINLMKRIIRQRGLDLAVVHDDTPETAPEFRRIFVEADNFESGETWMTHNIAAGEIFLEPHAVLVKAKRLPWGIGRIFNDEFLPRVDQALANPECWLKPDISSDPGKSEGGRTPKHQSKHRFWNLGGLLSKPETVAIASSLLALRLFTLLGTSAIVNPWYSTTSGEKDLKS